RQSQRPSAPGADGAPQACGSAHVPAPSSITCGRQHSSATSAPGPEQNWKIGERKAKSPGGPGRCCKFCGKDRLGSGQTTSATRGTGSAAGRKWQSLMKGLA